MFYSRRQRLQQAQQPAKDFFLMLFTRVSRQFLARFVSIVWVLLCPSKRFADTSGE